MLLFAVIFKCCMIGDWSRIPKLSFVVFFELRRANGARKISSLALSIIISSALRLGRMNHNEYCTRAYSSWVRFRSHSRPQSLRFFRSRGRRTRMFLSPVQVYPRQRFISHGGAEKYEDEIQWKIGQFQILWTKTLHQNNDKDITLLLHSQKPKDRNSRLK